MRGVALAILCAGYAIAAYSHGAEISKSEAALQGSLLLVTLIVIAAGW